MLNSSFTIVLNNMKNHQLYTINSKKWLIVSFIDRTSAFKKVQSLMKLGKQRPPRDRSSDSNSETRELLGRQDSSCSVSNEHSRKSSISSFEINPSDNESQVSLNNDQTDDVHVKPLKKLKPKVKKRKLKYFTLKPLLPHRLKIFYFT